MKLPHNLLNSPLFSFAQADELISVLRLSSDSQEAEQIVSLSNKHMPPVTSMNALATMLGVNSGLIWAFVNDPHKYYRTFEIPKGKKTRKITAPKVGLKIIQKWLSHNLVRAVPHLDHVYGFVPGRSHIDAAYLHRSAEWALSVDISNFFQTTPSLLVKESLMGIGYDVLGANLITSLTCLDDVLAQGAPSSPFLSNLCFKSVDEILLKLANLYKCEFSRYADDIVFSGRGTIPQDLTSQLRAILDGTPWNFSSQKEQIQPVKGRIKIHGLLIQRSSPRLTKGYRNKIRAYRHIIAKSGENAVGYHTLMGHIKYASHVDKKISKLTGLQDTKTSEANIVDDYGNYSFDF